MIIFILWFTRRIYLGRERKMLNLRDKIFRSYRSILIITRKVKYLTVTINLISLADLKSSFEYSTFQNRSLLTTRILKTKSSCSQFNYARAIKPFLIGFVHAKKGNRVHNNTPQSLDSAGEIAPLKDYSWKLPLSFYVTIIEMKTHVTDVSVKYWKINPEQYTEKVIVLVKFWNSSILW